MIHLIAAIDRRRALGYANRLLYYLPADLRHFKELTTGHIVIMGRKTFQSLPKGALPRRRNIVVSRSGTDCPGAEVYPSLAEALQACTNVAGDGTYASATGDGACASAPGPTRTDAMPSEAQAVPDRRQEVFIIGGASVYAQALPLADVLHLTEIEATAPQADVFFPAIDPDEWQEVRREGHPADERHAVPFAFVDLVKRKLP